MKRIAFLLVLIALTAASCASRPYTFSTEELKLQSGDNEVYGILYRPDGVKKAPLVIISHGFGGTHLFGKAYAEAMAPLGYAVYCYDFCGGSNFSRSEGKTSEMSIFTEAQDLSNGPTL